MRALTHQEIPRDAFKSVVRESCAKRQFASLMNDLNSSIDDISEKLKASVSNDTFNRILSKLNVQSLKLDERLTRKRQKKANALGVQSAAAVIPITSAKTKKPRNRRFKRKARPP